MSLENRYDFVYLFDVKDGNPNGDPDAGNLPRVDAETGMGLITDVCLKRKIRNFISLIKENEPGYEIYVKEKAVLNNQHGRAYVESDSVKKLVEEWKNYNENKKKKEDKKKKPKPETHYEDVAQQWVCENFYDVRTFGAVMSTSDTVSDEGMPSGLQRRAGQVRGPVQMTFARSVDPIVSQEHSITVIAARKADKPIKEQIGIQGRKFTVPYGLYIGHGFISAHLAQQTGFSEDDLELLLQALENMFEHDRSAARGEMTTRGLYMFKHDGKLGNAKAHDLFERISIELIDESKPPRAFTDYKISVEDSDMPKGVTLERRVG